MCKISLLNRKSSFLKKETLKSVGKPGDFMKALKSLDLPIKFGRYSLCSCRKSNIKTRYQVNFKNF